MSSFQSGWSKNIGTNNNMFLIRVIDHIKYLNAPIQIIFYDVEECFDSLWLKGSLLIL